MRASPARRRCGASRGASQMPSSGASWLIRWCLLTAPLDKEEPRRGISGSSAPGPRALQGKEGDVILLLPALTGEVLQLLYQGGGEVYSVLVALAQEVSQAWGSEHLAFRVVSLY